MRGPQRYLRLEASIQQIVSAPRQWNPPLPEVLWIFFEYIQNQGMTASPLFRLLCWQLFLRNMPKIVPYQHIVSRRLTHHFHSLPCFRYLPERPLRFTMIHCNHLVTRKMSYFILPWMSMRPKPQPQPMSICPHLALTQRRPLLPC